MIHDDRDNTIIVSGLYQGVVKLDYDNNVKWIIAPHLEWGENRRGEDLNEFLLQPLDAQGHPIEDEDVINGLANHPDFEWNWHQHAPFITPDGNVMFFDNGEKRNLTFTGPYSRGVEYKIDEEAMTIQQVWQYGKERGAETYAEIVSDVDYLPITGNILYAPGARVDNGGGFVGGRVIEVNYETKEVVFEARLNGPEICFHRAERIVLYD